MISPEEIAEICLGDKLVSQKDKETLFLEHAAVVVFDGLIIWRGDLNMKIAIPRLEVLAKTIGLPVAVIPKTALKEIKKKKQKPGKIIGPFYWDQSRAWDNDTGLDPSYWADYNNDCSTLDMVANNERWAEEDSDLYPSLLEGYQGIYE